ncbi:MAG: family 16 glycosylhydrolase [Acidimicrobiales bacterium]
MRRRSTLLATVGASLAAVGLAAALVGGLAAPAEPPASAAPDATTRAAGVGESPDGETSGDAAVAGSEPRPLMLAAWPRPVPHREPVVVSDLAHHAAAAFLGYHDAGSRHRSDGSWTLTLGSVAAADRAALGALSLGVAFSREGADAMTLTGAEPVLQPPLDADPAALRARLGAVAEVAADAATAREVDGARADLVAAVTDDPAAAARIAAVAQALDLSPKGVALADGRHAVTLPVPSDRWTVAGMPRACCRAEPEPWRESFDRPDLRRWRVATTGPLTDIERSTPPTSAGGVSWTNGEAQVYRPSQVAVVDGALRLRAEPSPVVSVETTPLMSGMVISERRFGWGRIEIDASIPQGAGLWPALWLLPEAACEAPGRCPGYETGDYVEVDLLETIGDEPGRLHTSVHWNDPGLVSVSEVHPLPIDDGAVRTFALDWRPGVMRFEVDGEVVWSFATATEAGSPVARPPDHRLVMNLAAGGTFAGDRLLGPTSPWWGDTRVPEAFPDLGWETADLVVHEVRYLPMQ